MSDQMAERPMRETDGYSRRTYDDPSPWAVGGAVFAATMMILVGTFQALAGLVALFNDTFYVATPEHLVGVDITAWGWLHLILGTVVLLAGFAILSGATWARVVGITLACLSAVANFLFIPYYPFWSILIIAVDVFVIWALASYNPRGV